FQNLLTAKSTVSIKDTMLLENGKLEKYLAIEGMSADSVTGLKTKHQVLARDVSHINDVLNKDMNLTRSSNNAVARALDQRVMSQIFKKSRVINEMLFAAFHDNTYTSPEKRIDLAFLDSIICYETCQDKLPMDFEFVLLNSENIPLKYPYPTPRYNAKMDTSNAAQALIFPSNMLDESIRILLKFPSKKSYLFKEMEMPLTISLMLVILIAVAISYMFHTILTQKKLSELKNDFISNMTHEFKTPISTISLACQAMNDKDMMGDAIDKSTPFVTMIQQENKRLEVLVERILQSATIEKSDVPFKQEDINLTELVNELAAHARFRLKAVNGVLKEDLPSVPVWITADKMHTSNMISNLLDNAIKYSNGEPQIAVNLSVTEKEIILQIKDHGIGISKEHIGKIFDKLYRVPTGNVHNVKGFGLGLSYVKAIVDLNGWKITVNSQLGKGSEFCIHIPFIAK
ncbi:MAG: sensor histidine kinase, partial [Crocinitomicaceae bacterium]|nr:sensor histidine kinase [Crocinitomicaceae bacterium]